MNKKFVKVLSYLGFLGSWYVSFLLNCTLAETKTDYLISFIFTTVMQFASFYFFVKREEHKNYIYIACVLFTISILGTMSYQLSIHNKVTNDNIKNSEEYKNHLANIELKNNLINDMKNEKAELKEMYTEQIESLVAQRDSMPNDYITRKAQVTDKINLLNKELANELTKINSSITTETSDLTNLNSTTIDSTSIRETKGYLGISQILAEWLDFNPDMVVLFIQFVIAIVFEGTAVCLHISIEEGGHEHDNKRTVVLDTANRHEHNSNNVRNTKSVRDSLKKKDTATTISVIDDISLKRYRDKMEETANNGKCIGYARIGILAGVKNARQIFEHLKQAGIIETGEGGTVIRKYQKKAI